MEKYNDFNMSLRGKVLANSITVIVNISRFVSKRKKLKVIF